ncbi:MAG: NAD(P)/FAD-dependent oxidoreductase [Clostridia bacterium]|nr:NAD(P)/FAD-dependent oxidoreductase [Clostridia bacterium]
MSKRVIVIGGGPAGMMAAGVAAQRGLHVKLIEQNKMLGKKLMITGKGRCNVTNACEDVQDLIANVPTNGSFLYSAFYGFTNAQTMEFFESMGVPLKVERGERVFPVSDKSQDIVSAMRRFLIENNVELICDRVDEILAEDGHVRGVRCQKRGEIYSDSVILATGGLSYQGTGSTGDGYTFAEDLGHTITDIRPSLVPVQVEEDWVPELAGLSLKNVALTVHNSKGKKVYTDFGELMFAHFGLTGPIVLSASAHMRNMGRETYRLSLDLKPALDEKQLDARICRDFQEGLNRDFRNSLGKLLPIRLIPQVIALSGIDPYKKVNSVTKEERSQLMHVIKNMEFQVVGFCPIEQAIITSGGVSVKEINPSTMESKLVSGLFFAGEIIDVDAYTGGFNLQIAFSTGHLAGSCC